MVKGAPSCLECSIELEPLATLGKETDPTSPESGSLVVRTEDGRFFVSRLSGTMGVGEYDAKGSLVAVHGRKGSGPGEYQMPPFSIARAPGDTLIVYDHPTRRFTVLAPDGRFVSSFQAPFRISDFAVAEDGSILVGGANDRGDPFELGPSAHFISRDGSTIKSVGDSVGPLRPDKPLLRSRTVAVSRSGTVAVAKRVAYEILILHADGSRRILTRRVPWFPVTDSARATQPQITKLWIDGEDRLWVSIYTRNPNATPEQIYSRDPGVALKTINFVVEVFDLRTGSLLATRRFDGPLVVNGGLASAPVAEPSGNVLRQVWIPTLTTSRR